MSHIFISSFTQTSWNLHFQLILVYQRAHSLFKTIFMASGLPQRPTIDIFHQAVFCSLASSGNNGRKRCSNLNRVVFLKNF